MKKLISFFALIVLCSLVMGSNGVASADTRETGKQTETKTETSSDEILYYAIEGEPLTIGLPYEWNAVYSGMLCDYSVFTGKRLIK